MDTGIEKYLKKVIWSSTSGILTQEWVLNLHERAEQGDLGAGEIFGLVMAASNGCPVGPEVVKKLIGENTDELEIAGERYSLPNGFDMLIRGLLAKALSRTNDEEERALLTKKILYFTELRTRKQGKTTEGWPYTSEHSHAIAEGVRGPGNYAGFVFGRIYRDFLDLIDGVDNDAKRRRGDFVTRLFTFIIKVDIADLLVKAILNSGVWENVIKISRQNPFLIEEILFVLSVANESVKFIEEVGGPGVEASKIARKLVCSKGYLSSENNLDGMRQIAECLVDRTNLFPKLKNLSES